MPPSSSASHLARLGLALFTVAVAAAANGCQAACDPSPDKNTPEVFSSGVVRGEGYETAGWSGPHLPFPGGKRYKLEHHLGFAPRTVSVFLAFGDSNTELAPCAGNTCVFCVDEQYVWLRNDTCSEFWVRVVAEGEGPTPPSRRCEDGTLIDAGEAVPGDAAAPGDVGEHDAVADDAPTPDATPTGQTADF